jgi:hypothetical protein
MDVDERLKDILDPTGLARLTDSEPKKKKSQAGRRFERCIFHALSEAGFQVQEQVPMGKRASSNRSHIIDFVATRHTRRIIVSAKWQSSPGSTEDKVPWEVICMDRTLKDSPEIVAGYVVLGGSGWKLRDYFCSEPFERDLPRDGRLAIVPLEKFLKLCFRDEV